jgi:hypothetical protein
VSNLSRDIAGPAASLNPITSLNSICGVWQKNSLQSLVVSRQYSFVISAQNHSKEPNPIDLYLLATGD